MTRRAASTAAAQFAYRLLGLALLLLLLHQSAILIYSASHLPATARLPLDPLTIALAGSWLLRLSLVVGLGGAGLYSWAFGEGDDPFRLRALLAGYVLVLLGTVLALLQDAGWGEAARAISGHLGYPLTAVALGYWLMARFSAVWTVWRRDSLRAVWLLLAAAGLLLVVAALPWQWAAVIGRAAAIIVPVLALIALAHQYRALATRADNASLAAHWFALAWLLWLLGLGLLGGLLAHPSVRSAVSGTLVLDAQLRFVAFAPLSMVLAVINQAGAELHGRDGRITGYIPFWLVSFGVTGGGVALATTGVVQAFLARAGVPLEGDPALLAPLYALWLLGEVLVGLGLAVYAVSFWARRPPA